MAGKGIDGGRPMTTMRSQGEESREFPGSNGDARIGALLRDIPRDVRFGFRYLRKRPVFALASILTLSLGIGMTTTMFTVLESVILKPLPGANTDRVVYLQLESEDGERETSPTPQLLRLLRDHSSSFSEVEAYSSEDFNLTLAGEPLRVRGARVSAGFFSFLGIRPTLGRGFLPEDGTGESSPTVVLDHTFWVERFGQDRDVLGRTIGIGDRIHEVIGVLPPEFRVDNRSKILLWIPEGAAGMVPEEGVPVEGALARLAPGVTPEAASAELDAIVRNNPLDRIANMVFLGKIRTPGELIDPRIKRTVLILQAAALLVLLIGCGNLTNLLLAQGETRARELALRSSLGAPKGRLIRQLLAENLALGILGGVGGILFIFWALRALPLFLPTGVSGFSFDHQVFLSATGLSLLSVLVVGLIPAWKGSRRNLSETIKGRSPLRRRGFGRVGIREVLVAFEVAMAVVLLVSAGLLLKSFAGLRGIDTGFDREGLLTLRVELPDERYGGDEAFLTFYDQLREGLGATLPPQLGTATVTSGLVENLELMMAPLVAEGAEGTQGEEPRLLFSRGVSPGYFRVLGIPLLQGREFEERDGRGTEPAVIVNSSLAKQYFAGTDPVGRRLKIGSEWHRVVGVAGSVVLPSLLRNNLAELQLFFPFRQSPEGGLTVVARITGDRTTALKMTQQVIRDLDPMLPIMRVALVDDLLSESLDRERSGSFLMAIFALTALVLVAVGIYGIVAYSVSQRIREIGIRLVLGATTRRVVAGVVFDSMRTVLTGIVLGVAVAAILESTVSRLLYDVDPRDPQVIVFVMVGIAGVALVAAWLPARRAAEASPLDALRSE
jgi:putative ABC transport system permease protein